MATIKLVHLIAVAMWGGVVLAEFVLELAAQDLPARRVAARVHYLIDMVIELPLLLTVLGTGAWLTMQLWPLDGWHLLKVACALVAMGSNLVCVGFVVKRFHAVEDDTALRRWDHLVRLTGVAMPFGLTAAYLGLTRLP